ncbi:glycosyltransferase family 2 protein [Lacinutrix sp. Bg11-31]|uniref:glycosyltransferase family 2 protein n=1 Tax=Lacinutrix sp. Bg11-31 TaxID=2057808 RepID=UPI000C30035E|nr:glycosyltransferase family 2 protein [Lacinutrix sp. Bg11-31]AUC83392.1 glycosyl transferase family 2 [Lacinutrix sp. Bg11-31]
MNFYIVIPAHNEADFIAKTLESLVSQTLQPKSVVVVNDNSTDDTQAIVTKFIKQHHYISIVNIESSNSHLPGSKIINAFYKGFDTLDDNYDIVCKFDADLIFPENYLETLVKHFQSNKMIGMAAGYCYIEQKNIWIREKITGKDHIRGALKAYTKKCFLDIGMLKKDIGWDTIDEILAKFYKWDILLDDDLKVKHLKPTGANYTKQAKLLQGEAMYKMRYGFVLTFILGVYNAFKRSDFGTFNSFVSGYLKARKNNFEPFVSKEQGEFVRRERWKGFRKKLGF